MSEAEVWPGSRQKSIIATFVLDDRNRRVQREFHLVRLLPGVCFRLILKETIGKGWNLCHVQAAAACHLMLLRSGTAWELSN
jgi:hypothetical protein